MNILKAIEVLAIQSGDIDSTALKQAYRKMLFQWHPDRHEGKSTLYEAVERTKQINIAYEILSEHIETRGSITRNTSNKQKTRQARRTYRGERYTPGFPDPSIVEIFLKSSHIISTGYNNISRMLYIKFSPNTVYRYYEVSRAVFDDFLIAESHGKFAHKHIYHSYRYEHCEEPNVPYSGPPLDTQATPIPL